MIRLMGASEDRLRWRFLGNLQEALAENEGKLQRKALSLTVAQGSLFGAVALLGEYFLVAIAGGWVGST